MGYDLFAQQAPAPALDQAEAPVHLVGAVHSQVNAHRLIHRDQRHAGGLRRARCRLGGGHGADAGQAAGPDHLAQPGDENLGGGA